MRDSGEFTTIEIHEGTNKTAAFVLHPDTHGGSVRAAVAPFADHNALGWSLIVAASALGLPPDVQVRLLVCAEVLASYVPDEGSTGDDDRESDDSIPF